MRRNLQSAIVDLPSLPRLLVLASLTACAEGTGAGGAPPSVPIAEHVSAGGTAPAGATLENPFDGDSASAAEGEQLYATMNCDGCHAGGALGATGPSLVDGRWRHGGSDGALFHSIYYGRSKGMPAYGGMLSADAIWKIVTYVRSQPVPALVPTETWR